MSSTTDEEALVSAFADPPNVAVFTTKSVLAGSAVVRLVTHEAEDGAWQFFDDDDVPQDHIRVVSLHTILRTDPTIAEVADLPLGWVARRAAREEAWSRHEQGSSG